MSKNRIQLMLCGGTGCHSTGSKKFEQALQKELEAKGLADEIKIIETGCNGFCAVGPVMLVQPEGVFYQKLKVSNSVNCQYVILFLLIYAVFIMMS